ncbi:hypothetical protein BLAT2472_10632 [Burkholderia latens]
MAGLVLTTTPERESANVGTTPYGMRMTEYTEVLRDFNGALRRTAFRCTLIRHFCYTRHALDCSRQTKRQHSGSSPLSGG